ncbi:hypothetical protein ACFQ71_38790 [Streptomyces sp. NPDC056534]|uniref:hypothetical protein n=1 Tax=Streptomyces sp. NPDC056534 TaxID=3345857 RepID=UPI003692C69E
MLGGGEAAHVQTDLGEDDLGGGRSEAGDRVQTLGQFPRGHRATGRRRAGVVCAGRSGSCAVVWGPGLSHEVGDQPVEFPDLRGEVVDGAQQHSQQAAVMFFELPGECLGQGRLLLHQTPLGEIRQNSMVAFTGGQGVEHGPAEEAEEVRDDVGQLDLRVLQSLVDPVLVPSALLDEDRAGAGEFP